MYARRVSFAGALAMLLTAAVAGADAVQPPPKSCPRGMQGVESHNSPGCVPKLCADGCSLLEHCETLPFCIVDRDEPLRGGGVERVSVARGPCDASATCTGELGESPGSHPCTPLQVCVRGSGDSKDPQSASSSWCGCRLVGQPESRAGFWLALAAIAGVAARRRPAAAARSTRPAVP